MNPLTQQHILETLNHHAIVSVADRAGIITHVNDKFCEITGYTRKELTGKTHRFIKSGLHTDTFYKEMWSTIVKGDVWKGEVCNRRKDGSLYWTEATIVPFLDEKGRPYQYTSIRTEITHVKEYEQKLLKQTKILHLLNETTTLVSGAITENFKDTLDEVLEKIGKQLNCRGICLWTFHPSMEIEVTTQWWSASLTKPELTRLKEDFSQHFQKGVIPKGIGLDEYLEKIDRKLKGESEGASEDENINTSTSFFPIRTGGKTSHMLQLVQSTALEEQNADAINLMMILADSLSSTFSHRSAQGQLAVETDRFRRSQFNARIGTIDYDLHTGQLYFSESLPLLYGRAASTTEFSFEDLINAIHPEDRQQVRTTINHCIHTQTPYEIEHRAVWPDGSVHWLMSKGAITLDSDGKPILVSGISQDIDQRKWAELELKESRKKLQQAQELSKIGYWEVNLKTRKIIWSEEAFHIHNKDPKTFTPGFVSILGSIHPKDRQACLEAISFDSPVRKLQYRIILDSGEIRYLYLLIDKENSTNESQDEIRGTIQDITERVVTEQNLKESQLRFSLAIEGTGDKIWEVELTDNKVSNTWELSTSGLQSLVYKGQTVLERVHPEDMESSLQALDYYLAGEESIFHTEVLLICTQN